MSRSKKRNLTIGGILLALLLCMISIAALGGTGITARADVSLPSLESLIYTDASAFQFTAINSTECSVKLVDKTRTKVYVPKKAIISGIEYTVTQIALSGFSSAAELNTVILPKTIYKIGNNAFQNCKKLELMYAPAVKEIGSNSFALCTALTDIIFPATVETVGSSVFTMAKTKVHARFDAPQSGWATNWNTGNTVQLADHDFNRRDENDRLWTHDFIYEQVQKMNPLTRTTSTVLQLAALQPFMEGINNMHLEILDVVDEIPQYAFSECNIESLTVLPHPDSKPINIQSTAFFDTDVTNGITINRETTYGFDGMDSDGIFTGVKADFITLPTPQGLDGRKVILGQMFVSSEINNINFFEIESGISNILYEDAGVVRIPDGVEEIRNQAFGNVNSIKHLYIPASVETIEEAFEGWDSTQTIHVPFLNEAEANIAWGTNWKGTCFAGVEGNQTEFDVTFSAEDSSVANIQFSAFNTIVQKGKTLANIANIPTPTSDSHTFTGKWYKDIARTQEILPTDAITSDLTLYAGWEINRYTITFADNNVVNYFDNFGEPLSGSYEYTYGKTVRFYVEAAEFYDQNPASIKVFDYNQQLSLTGPFYTIAMNQSRNISATGTANQYNIYYDLAGGTHYGNPTQYSSDKNLTIPNMPEKTGYDFTGWKIGNIPANGIEQWSLGNKTLTATWTPCVYTISYYSNLPEQGNQVEGGMENSKHTYDNIKPLSKNQYAIEGWVFTGWHDEEHDVYYKDEALVNIPVERSNIVVTLYAQWAKAQCTVTFNINGGSYLAGNLVQIVNYNERAVEPEVFKTGYILKWDKAFLNVKSDMIVTAVWKDRQEVYNSLTKNDVFDSSDYFDFSIDPDFSYELGTPENEEIFRRILIGELDYVSYLSWFSRNPVYIHRYWEESMKCFETLFLEGKFTEELKAKYLGLKTGNFLNVRSKNGVSYAVFICADMTIGYIDHFLPFYDRDYGYDIWYYTLPGYTLVNFNFKYYSGELSHITTTFYPIYNNGQLIRYEAGNQACSATIYEGDKKVGSFSGHTARHSTPETYVGYEVEIDGTLRFEYLSKCSFGPITIYSSEYILFDLHQIWEEFKEIIMNPYIYANYYMKNIRRIYVLN